MTIRNASKNITTLPLGRLTERKIIDDSAIMEILLNATLSIREPHTEEDQQENSKSKQS